LSARVARYFRVIDLRYCGHFATIISPQRLVASLVACVLKGLIFPSFVCHILFRDFSRVLSLGLAYQVAIKKKRKIRETSYPQWRLNLIKVGYDEDALNKTNRQAMMGELGNCMGWGNK
jgi:hypothetical protein